MIERGKLPGQVERLAVTGGRRAHQANVTGDGAERGHQRDGLQVRVGRVLAGITQRQRIGEKNRIQQAFFRQHRQLPVIVQIGQRATRCQRVAPGAFMVAAAHDEEIEMQLAVHVRPC